MSLRLTFTRPKDMDVICGEMAEDLKTTTALKGRATGHGPEAFPMFKTAQGIQIQFLSVVM